MRPLEHCTFNECRLRVAYRLIERDYRIYPNAYASPGAGIRALRARLMAAKLTFLLPELAWLAAKADAGIKLRAFVEAECQFYATEQARSRRTVRAWLDTRH